MMLPPGAERDFDEVWEPVSDYVGRAVEQVTCDRVTGRDRQYEPEVV